VPKWHEEVTGIARLVAENDDDSHHRETFIDLVCQVVLEQPLKTPFVAAVVLVLNTLKAEIAFEVLRKIAQATEDKIKLGDWRGVKLNLKFLACLQTCLEGEGLFPLLEDLFSRAVDLQTASSDDVSNPRTPQLFFGAPYANAKFQDHRDRARQDHPAHFALHHGRGAGSMAAKGGRADGKNRHHCLRSTSAAGAGRPLPSPG